MSCDNYITVFRGIRITEDLSDFDRKLTDFIKTSPTSPFIASCAESFEIEKEDVNCEDLWEYLYDDKRIIWNEDLDSFFIGETLYTKEGQNDWVDLADFTELTTDIGEVTEFITKYYNNLPIKTYFISWTS